MEDRKKSAARVWRLRRGTLTVSPSQNRERGWAVTVVVRVEVEMV